MPSYTKSISLATQQLLRLWRRLTFSLGASRVFGHADDAIGGGDGTKCLIRYEYVQCTVRGIRGDYQPISTARNTGLSGKL